MIRKTDFCLINFTLNDVRSKHERSNGRQYRQVHFGRIQCVLLKRKLTIDLSQKSNSHGMRAKTLEHLGTSTSIGPRLSFRKLCLQRRVDSNIAYKSIVIYNHRLVIRLTSDYETSIIPITTYLPTYLPKQYISLTDLLTKYLLLTQYLQINLIILS